MDNTYFNDATNSHSLMDNFIVSDSLIDNVNKYCTVKDVGNMQIIFPLLCIMSLSVNSTF